MAELCVDPELEASAAPAGLEKIQGGEVAAPSSSLKRKKKELTSAAPEDEEAVLIQRLKDEAMALILKGKKPEEDARPPARKRKKYIKERLPQGLIDYMIKWPRNSMYDIPQERLAKRSTEFRESYLRRKAIADKVFEYEQVLIGQYLTKGYADDEVEVTDDEDEE